MKSTRGLFMLLVALIAGGAAVMFATRWMQAQAQGGGQIVVAAVDVELGGRLTPEMLRMVQWPSGSVPAGSFDKMAALDGRVVKTTLVRGEPVLEGKLAPVGTKGGLSAVVQEGKRAMTVRVKSRYSTVRGAGSAGSSQRSRTTSMGSKRFAGLCATPRPRTDALFIGLQVWEREGRRPR